MGSDCIFLLNKFVSGVFISCAMFLLLRDLYFRTYLSALQLVLSECVAVLKSLPVLHHGADYSVWSLGSMTSFWALSNILLKELQLCIYNNCS